jgi:hypothetical protein
MDQETSGRATSRAGRRSALVALAIAALVAAVALSAQAAGQETAVVPAWSPDLVGEHSALGERRVDDLNAVIGSSSRVRGEHAGLSRADYEADSALDAGR